MCRFIRLIFVDFFVTIIYVGKLSMLAIWIIPCNYADLRYIFLIYLIKVDKQLSIPTSPSTMPNLSFEEKMEVDAKSVYIGKEIVCLYLSGSYI